jgi:hypothetical protein
MRRDAILRVLTSLPPGIEAAFSQNGGTLEVRIGRHVHGGTMHRRVYFAEVELKHAISADTMVAQEVLGVVLEVDAHGDAWDAAANEIAHEVSRRRHTITAATLWDGLGVWVRDHAPDLVDAWGVLSRKVGTREAMPGTLNGESHKRMIVDAVRSAVESIEPGDPDMNATSADERHEQDARQRMEHDR